MEITSQSWAAVVDGMNRDARKISTLKKQVEKLSWMLVTMEGNDMIEIEDLEVLWLAEKEDRYERLGPYV